MTAGTVVITGGILATVILLCIIVVLCYCRLQYYCCKNGSDADSPSYSETRFSCDACSPSNLDASNISPLSISPEVPFSSCPTCNSFYNTSFHLRNMCETRNGAERIAAMLPSSHSTSLSSRTLPEFYCNTHAISTDV